MQINSQRFGVIEFDEDAVLSFPAGIIGFPREHSFALIPHQGSSFLAWLQSLSKPELAFPVVSAHYFGNTYPDVPVTPAAHAAGLQGKEDEFAVLLVLCAPIGQPATVNLLAPIVINTETRTGGQVILDGSRFSTREVFVATSPAPAEAAPAAQAEDDNSEPLPALAAG